MKTSNAKIYSKETITQLMDDARKSISNGESICSIARRHQIPHTTLHQWINKYIPEHKPKPFVKVTKNLTQVKTAEEKAKINITYYEASISVEAQNIEAVIRAIKAASQPLAPQNI